MVMQMDAERRPVEPDTPWYARTADDIAEALGVDPAVGLSAAKAAELLDRNGPNALPEEKPKPGWRRFLDEYRSYMQIILIAAAVVSLVIKEWGDRCPAARADGAERGRRPSPAGQGRKRHERAEVDDEGDRPGAARRDRVRDPGRAARRRRHRAHRRRRPGSRRRTHRRGERAADRRVRADRGEHPRGQGRHRRCPATDSARATRPTWPS